MTALTGQAITHYLPNKGISTSGWQNLLLLTRVILPAWNWDFVCSLSSGKKVLQVRSQAA